MHRDVTLSRPARVRVQGVSVACHDRQSAINTLVDLHDAEQPTSCFFVNAHSINISRQSQDYFDAVHRSNLVLNDGVGLDLAARISGTSFPDNLNGTDLVPQLLAVAQELGWSVYLLGSRPGVPEQAAEALSREFPELRICGAHHGYLQDDEAEVVREINECRPDLLLVGMGNPHQEIFIDRMISSGLMPNVRLSIGVGAYLDFAAGKVLRAPRAVRALRLEWGWRLLQEPSRLWRRYLVGNWSFLFWTLVWQLRHLDAVELSPEPAAAYPDGDRALDSMIPQRRIIDLTAVQPPRPSGLIEQV